jgi:hypothetical protein
MRVTAGIVLTMATALILLVAGPASAGTGGEIPAGSVWSVKATPGVSCRKARQVIKASGFGEKLTALGFHCTSGQEGQYGFAVKCHKGRQTVTGTTGA